MLPSSSIRPSPLSEPNSSRNIRGKAREKKAANGLRRNSLFWARTWRQSRARSDGRPWGRRSGTGRLRGGGELEVDVLEGRPGHGEGAQLLPAGQGPAGEDVEGPGGLGGPQHDPVLVRRRPGGQAVGQVGQAGPGGQPEGDDRFALVAATQGVGGAAGHDP